MLFISETHRIIGARFDDFESHYRDRWLPAVAKDPGTRFLWYFNRAHGSSVSFNVVTITAAADFDAWARLQQRVESGDMQELAHTADQMRYGTSAAINRRLEWSRMPEIDLASVPTAAQDHERTMYIEDTVRVSLDDPDAGEQAIRAAHRGLGEPGAGALTEFVAAFRPVSVAGRRSEVTLLQRILDLGVLAKYYVEGDLPPNPPWSAAHAATPFDDTWQTRVLRAAPWSPLA